ncbi:MAG TPA: SCO family protein [Bryobacteraceae bacterium]|nr:SCO family protein [Bryobacteraceae bacterium]
MAIDPVQQTLTVSHRPIPKYMPAMVMPFAVQKADDLAGLAPGVRVRFELEVERGRSVIRHIVKVGAETPPLPGTVNAIAVGARIPDFALTNQDNLGVKLSNLRGKVVAVNFIYTRCPLPDVCPRLAAGFAALQRRFRASLDRDLILLSITIDPQNDTPEVLKEYAKRWQADKGWHFLTGPMETVRQVAGSFGIVYWPEEDALSHTSVTGVIGRDGSLAAAVEGSSFRIDQLGDIVARQLEATK